MNDLKVLVLTEDEIATANLARMIEPMDPKPVVTRAPVASPAAAIRANEPDVVLLLLETLDEKGARMVEEAVGARAGSSVVVALGKQEKDALINLIKVGAADVIAFPLEGEELRRSLAVLASRRTAGAPARTGRMWSVFGAGGGCGVTTIAVNLAERLAHGDGSVCIADLNLEMGDVPVFLNMKPRYTLTDLVVNAAKIDSAYLGSTVATHSSGLRVLPGPREIEEADEVTPARLRTVLRALRNNYDHLVVDTPSIFNETTVEALDHSDGILLVAMLNIPSVRNARRIHAAFERFGYPAARVRLVINRQEKHGDISMTDAASLVGLPVFHAIPNDYPSVIRGINVGEPIASVAPRSPIVRALDSLATKLREESVVKPAPAKAAPHRFRLFAHGKEA